MNNKRLYMDVHVIQTMPTSNINRDDLGSPKTAQYGGVCRARVSSQAWKRAIRNFFIENGKGVGTRTKNVADYVNEKIKQLAPELAEVEKEEAFNKAKEVLKDAKITNASGVASALFFLGDRQAENLAKAILKKETDILNKKTRKKETDKDKIKEILKKNPEIDIVLFGRMVADVPELNTDAVCQVAHAISTHAVQTEFDYFTALDDHPLEGQSGAAMIQNSEFNSPTLYRYANVAVHEFNKLLRSEDTTLAACELFVKAFANSMPSGKANSYANQTVPSMLMVTLREDRPVNLVSAFEKPVRANGDSGYVNTSIIRLSEELKKSQKFVDEPIANFYITTEDVSIGDMGTECESMMDLQQKIGEALRGVLDARGE